MKRPASTRRECVQDYQRPIRRKQFSPSPIRKSQSSRTSSHAKVSKFQSANALNAAIIQPCITNNKENFGVEPTIRNHADRQKKTALGCLREHPLPPAVPLPAWRASPREWGRRWPVGMRGAAGRLLSPALGPLPAHGERATGLPFAMTPPAWGRPR